MGGLKDNLTTYDNAMSNQLIQCYSMGHQQFGDLFPYIKDESRDRGISLYVDHGQCIWEVTLTGAHEEQPGHKNP